VPFAWQSVDLRGDPDEAEYQGDPADLLIDLAELLQRPAWHSRAACRGRGLTLWFPQRGQSLGPAREVCADCPVKDECLAAALEMAMHTDHGVWAGTSERQRKQLRRVTADEAA
jgi:hypothetical protein